MTFVLIFRVPIDRNGWTGTDHLPTLQIEACTPKDARAKVSTILAHLPEGTWADITPV
jgi:hypothetical protein